MITSRDHTHHNMYTRSSRPFSVSSLIHIAFLALTVFTSTAHTRQPPTSFCKCICFQNSTIIPLNSPPNASPSPALRSIDLRSSSSGLDLTTPRNDLSPRFPQDGEEEESDDKTGEHHRKLTCADCNRAFCLDYNLPICKNAKEEDVFTTCFQRDSVKDETVVLLFLCTTVGLLGWAIIKPLMDKFRGGSGSLVGLSQQQQQQQYNPVSTESRSRNGGSLPTFGHGRYDSSMDETDPRTRGVGRYRGDSIGSGVARQGGLNS